jgi:hypothetical protein
MCVGFHSMCVADLCELSGYEEVRRSSAHEASLQDATHVSTVHSCAKAARRNQCFSVASFSLKFCGPRVPGTVKAGNFVIGV